MLEGHAGVVLGLAARLGDRLRVGQLLLDVGPLLAGHVAIADDAGDDVADLTEPATAETTSPQPDTQPVDEAGTSDQDTPATSVEDSPVAAAVEPSAAEVPAPSVVAEPAPLDQPVVRTRLKRGRVVAPAGPPKAADLEQSEGDR